MLARVALVSLLALACAARPPSSGPRPVTSAAPAKQAVAPSPSPPTPARPRAANLAVTAVREFRSAHADAIIDELLELLRIPNVAANRADMAKNAAWLQTAFERRGFEVELMDGYSPPYVVAHRISEGATKTLALYMHYDGQPVDASAWVGHGPYEPVFRLGRLEDNAPIVPRPAPIPDDARIYARSASDDRAPIIALLATIDALDAANVRPASNLTVVLEGDEEAGSPQVARFARAHADKLAAQLLVVFDGPQDPGGVPVVFGVRGLTSLRVEVFGARQPLHSGHYGNWAPNPAMALAQLLASMTDPDTRRVVVEGFYDDRISLTPAERQAIGAITVPDEQRPQALGFAEPAGPWPSRYEAVSYPSLNVRGLQAGWVRKEARTIIPDVSVAEIDLRLVPDIRPQAQAQRVVEHIRKQGYEVLGPEDEVTDALRAAHSKLARVSVTESGYPAARTAMDLPVCEAVLDVLRATQSQPVLAIPTSGGSLPMFAFTEIAGLPSLMISLVNHDNNQHAPNENLRVGHLWAGMEAIAALVTAELP